MKPQCIDAVNKAVGRELTDAELRGIEDRISRHIRQNAAKDPQGTLAMTAEQRYAEAAASAHDEFMAEQAKKAQRVALQVLANNRIEQHLAQFGGNKLDGLARVIAFHADTKGNFLSMETQAKAIERDALRQMIGTMEASNPKFFGLFENAEGIRAIVRELFGEETGVKEAKEGAAQFKAVAESLRQRFNRAGGQVGQLEDWGMPHHHSQLNVAKAGREQWIADILPKLNRDRYRNADGTMMSDQQVSEFLGQAWETIATGGVNKIEPGQPRGSGMRANRGNEGRQIHFADADAYMAYQEKYGERTLYEVMTHHIMGVAKDIAMVETLGPNPDHAFRSFRDAAVKEATLADPTKAGKIQQRAIGVENLYNLTAGKTLPVASEWLAKTFDTLRSWLTASRLGSAVISSLSDEATLYLTAHVNNLPEMRVLANELAALNPANQMEKRMALRAGLAMNTFISSLNRFGQEGLGSSFSSKLASTVLRASGLNAMTDARRRAFGVTMMSSLGQITREFDGLGKLDKADHRILLSKGITETDWAIWRKAQVEDWGNGNDTMLTPESIYRIPRDEIAAAISPKIENIRAETRAQINELNQRNLKDSEWLQKRFDKFSAAQESAKKRIGELAVSKDDKAKAVAESIRNKIELLQAEIERVRVRRDIEAAFANEKNSDKLRMLMDDVNFAASQENGDAAAASIGRRNSSIGYSYGMREGSLKRRIVELEKRIRTTENSVWSDVKAADKAEAKRLDDLRDELAQFWTRSNERQARRQFVMDRLDNSIDPSIDNAITSAREQAATRLLGAVLEETDVAVIEPGVRERAMMQSGLQRGTWKGELTRSFFLFKSFPLAMLTRHWMRGMDMETSGGKAAYIASLVAATTIMGAASLQINEVLSGRDPRNLNPAEKGGVRNWIQAMLKGGSLGIYGDFLFSDATQHGQSPVASFMGPVVGMGEDLFNLTQGNLVQLSQGKATHAGAELVKFGKSNLPGANLWYTKAALDHMVFHQMQEYFSPGYLSTMRSRAYREFGQQFWWEPGEMTPDRAPNPAAAVGER